MPAAEAQGCQLSRQFPSVGFSKEFVVPYQIAIVYVERFPGGPSKVHNDHFAISSKSGPASVERPSYLKKKIVKRVRRVLLSRTSLPPFPIVAWAACVAGASALRVGGAAPVLPQAWGWAACTPTGGSRDPAMVGGIPP